MKEELKFRDMVDIINNASYQSYPVGYYGFNPNQFGTTNMGFTPYSRGRDDRNLNLTQTIDLNKCFTPLFVKCINDNFKKTYYKKFKEMHLNDIKYLDKVKDISPDMELLYTRVFSKIGRGYVKPCVTKRFDDTFFPEGFVPSNIYTITAMSGGGKTALAVNITTSLMLGFNSLYDNEIREPSKVTYISLEQSKYEIRARILSAISGIMDLDNALSTLEISTHSIPDSKIDLYETSLNVYHLFEDSIMILDKEDFGYDLSIEGVLKVVEQKRSSFEPQLIILDQIVNIVSDTPDCDNHTPMELKSYSQKREIPILVVTQMNKDARKANRKGDIDLYSGNDIRGSGYLEHQSTSIIVFQLTVDKSGKSDGKVDVKSVKARYGKHSKISMKFHGSCNLFEDSDEDENDELEDGQEARFKGVGKV